MDIWRPAPSKLTTLPQDNPRYWSLCVSRSQYSEAEILATLAEIEAVNDEWQSLQGEIYTNILTDENGEMDSLRGYASDTHRKIHRAIVTTDYISPSFSQNSHSNCFPVAKWQKDITRTRREMAKIRQMATSS